MIVLNIISGKRGKVVGRATNNRYIVAVDGEREFVDALDFVAQWKPVQATAVRG